MSYTSRAIGGIVIGSPAIPSEGEGNAFGRSNRRPTYASGALSNCCLLQRREGEGAAVVRARVGGIVRTDILPVTVDGASIDCGWMTRTGTADIRTTDQPCFRADTRDFPSVRRHGDQS